MRRIRGNAIELFKTGKYAALAHGCNCFRNMAGGFAYQVSKEFPQAVLADNKSSMGDRDKLGDFTLAIIHVNNKERKIYNLYTQYRGGANLDYQALRDSLDALNREVSLLQSLIYKPKLIIPMIGAGIAGGDKEIIIRTMETYLTRWRVTLVEFYQP